MNELLPGWPVEAVNLGVGGYNIWNGWLGFKHGPQVYDGVVLVLCNNDADIFCRSYQVVHPRPNATTWESTRPSGAAVARCFDDIALFSQASSLPVAVCFYNVYDHPAQLRIGEIIADLCASRGLCFIDTFAHFRDRKFARADLLVSPANSHPSAMAHEAVGRHLTARLKSQGWFSEYEASPIGAAPDRILAAAEAMVDINQYPPDAALNWALGALDAKSHLGRRLQASGADDDFSAASARVAEALGTANRRWHVIHRTRAFMADVAAGGRGLAAAFHRAQEQSLRLDELGFALGTGDWERVATSLLETGPTKEQCAPDEWPSDVAARFDGCGLALQSFRNSLDGMRTLARPIPLGSPHDEGSMLADLETLAGLADRAEFVCRELKSAFLRLEPIFNDARPALSEEHIAHVSRLVGAALAEMKENLGFISRLPAAIEQVRDAKDSPFTTADVTMCGESLEGKPVCALFGTVEYSAPNRLPFHSGGNFYFDGSPSLVRLYFPTFYAGRLILRPSLPKAANLANVETTVVKVELYNGKNQHRTLESASFCRERPGCFVSPIICLA
jgi:hypothetical protein